MIISARFSIHLYVREFLYYWVQKRPQIFGLISAFVLGLTVDICSTAPLGVNCLLLMIFSFILNKIFYYIKPASFIADWLFFLLSDLIFMLVKWLSLVIYFQEYLNINTVVLNIFSTVMFYPLIAYFNNFIRTNFLPQEGINE